MMSLFKVIREVEEKNDKKLIIQGNALKRRSDEKQSQVGTLEESNSQRETKKDYLKSDKHSPFC